MLSDPKLGTNSFFETLNMVTFYTLSQPCPTSGTWKALGTAAGVFCVIGKNSLEILSRFTPSSFHHAGHQHKRGALGTDPGCLWRPRRWFVARSAWNVVIFFFFQLRPAVNRVIHMHNRFSFENNYIELSCRTLECITKIHSQTLRKHASSALQIGANTWLKTPPRKGHIQHAIVAPPNFAHLISAWNDRQWLLQESETLLEGLGPVSNQFEDSFFLCGGTMLYITWDTSTGGCI